VVSRILWIELQENQDAIDQRASLTLFASPFLVFYTIMKANIA
jgi:hypothetical protein